MRAPGVALCDSFIRNGIERGAMTAADYPERVNALTCPAASYDAWIRDYDGVAPIDSPRRSGQTA